MNIKGEEEQVVLGISKVGREALYLLLNTYACHLSLKGKLKGKRYNYFKRFPLKSKTFFTYTEV